MGGAFTHWDRDSHYPLKGSNSSIPHFVKGDLDVFVPYVQFNTNILPAEYLQLRRRGDFYT